MRPFLWLFSVWEEPEPVWSTDGFAALCKRYGRDADSYTDYFRMRRSEYATQPFIERWFGEAWDATKCAFHVVCDVADVTPAGGNRLANRTREVEAISSWRSKDGTPYARRSLAAIDYDLGRGVEAFRRAGVIR